MAESTDQKSFEEIFDFVSKDDAERSAKSRAKRIARSTKSFDIELVGRLDIPAGAKVTLVGFPANVDGSYTAKQVKHTITPGGGWTMTVSGEGAA